MHAPRDVASIRLDNALALFDEFVRNTIKHPDAATLRGLERRFAERLQIQPSYWSQIKSRSRLIGERLARQFEQCCQKPAGWMDAEHAAGTAAAVAAPPHVRRSARAAGRRRALHHRPRAHLLSPPSAAGPHAPAGPAGRGADAGRRGARPGPIMPPPRKLAPGVTARPPAPPPPPDDPLALWHSAQAGIAPLKKKR
jgi:hypothetical protein